MCAELGLKVVFWLTLSIRLLAWEEFVILEALMGTLSVFELLSDWLTLLCLLRLVVCAGLGLKAALWLTLSIRLLAWEEFILLEALMGTLSVFELLSDWLTLLCLRCIIEVLWMHSSIRP